MPLGFMFFFNNILTGIGLAMDAFSVSVANGLKEPAMKLRKVCLVAATFAVFQAVMPFSGWVFVHTAAQHFKQFQKFIPWIALLLLCYIGGKMIYDSVKNKCGEENGNCKIGLGALMVQGVATSIDALSVGFMISDYDITAALLAAIIIAIVTFIICFAGVIIGKGAQTLLCDKAGIFGGCILIFIGIEIFISNLLR